MATTEIAIVVFIIIITLLMVGIDRLVPQIIKKTILLWVIALSGIAYILTGKLIVFPIALAVWVILKLTKDERV